MARYLDGFYLWKKQRVPPPPRKDDILDFKMGRGHSYNVFLVYIWKKLQKKGNKKLPRIQEVFGVRNTFWNQVFFCLFLVGGAGQIGKVYFFNPISSESCSTVIHCSPTVLQPQIFLFELFVYQIKLPLVPHFCCPFSSMESAQCLLLQLVSPSVPQLLIFLIFLLKIKGTPGTITDLLSAINGKCTVSRAIETLNVPCSDF